MNVLGGTISLIAREKAGILKAIAPAFCVPQLPDAVEVLQAQAAAVGTTLATCEAREADAVSLPFWLSPSHQQHNAAMALAMLESLAAHGHLPPEHAAWVAARDSTCWPARFEVLTPTPLLEAQRLVLDVGHNEPAVEALLRSVGAAFPGQPLVVVFGANFDKDVRKIVALVGATPTLCGAVAVQSSHPKAVPTSQILAEVASVAQDQTPATPTVWGEALSMLAALGQAGSLLAAAGGAGTVLCCGSVFVVADMRAALAAQQPKLFRKDDWAFDEAGEPPLLM